MSDSAIERRLDFIGIGDTERCLLTALQPRIAVEVSAALDRFYLIAVQITSPVHRVAA